MSGREGSLTPEDLAKELRITENQANELGLNVIESAKGDGIFGRIAGHFRGIAMALVTSSAFGAAAPAFASHEDTQFTKRSIAISKKEVRHSNRYVDQVLQNIKKNNINVSALSRNSIDDFLKTCGIKPTHSIKASIYEAIGGNAAHGKYNKANPLHNGFTLRKLHQLATKADDSQELLKAITEAKKSVLEKTSAPATPTIEEKAKEEKTAPVILKTVTEEVVPVILKAPRQEIKMKDMLPAIFSKGNESKEASFGSVPKTPEEKIEAINSSIKGKKENPSNISMGTDGSINSIATLHSDGTIITNMKAGNLGAPKPADENGTIEDKKEFLPSFSTEYNGKTFKVGAGLEAMRDQQKNLGIMKLYVGRLHEITSQKGGVYLEFKEAILGEKYQKIVGGVLTTIGSRSKLNLSAADLQKFQSVNLEGTDRSFTGHKYSFGGEFEYLSDEFVRGFGGSVVYSQTDNHEFGLLKTYAEEAGSTTRQMENYGYYQGSRVVEAGLISTMKLGTNTRLKAALGLHNQEFNNLGKDVMGNPVVTQNNSTTSAYGNLNLTQHALEDRLKLEADANVIPGVSEKGRVGAGYYIRDGVVLEGYAEEALNHQKGIKNVFTAMLGLKFEFGSKAKGFGKANPSVKERMDINLSDLKPVSGVDSDEMYGRTFVNKVSVFEADSGVRKNNDGTLDAIIQGNGKLKADMTGVYGNPAGAERFFHVEKDGNIVFYGREAAEFNKRFGPVSAMIGFMQTDGNIFVLDQKIEKGSVHLKAKRTLGDFPIELAADFFTNKLDQRMVEDLFSKFLQMNAAKHMQLKQGFFADGVLETKYLQGSISSAVINGIDTGRFTADQIQKLKDGTLSGNQAEDILKNHNPIASEANITLDMNGSFSGKLVATDEDVGDVLSFSLATAPQNGTVVINQDGSYTYTAKQNFAGSDSFSFTVSDGKGAATATIQINVVDNLPPAQPAFTGIINGTTYGTSVTPNVTTVSGNTYSSTLDGAAYILGTSVSTDGTHTLVVTATKTSNNKTSSNTATFTIDTAAPAAPSFTGIINGTTYGTSVTPNVTAVSGNTYSATLDGNPYALGTSVSTDGTHTLVATATKSLNGKTSSNTATFTIDTASPSVPAFTGITNGTTYGTSVTPNVTTVSGNAYSATLDGNPYVLGTVVSADGTHTIAVTATKSLNGKTSSNTATFTIDTTAPMAPSFTGFVSGNSYGGSVTPNVNSVSGISYSATLDGNPFVLGSSVTSDGTHNLIVTATKTLNGKTSSNTGTFKIDTTSPAAPALTGFVSGTSYGTSVTPNITPVAGNTYSATLDGNPYVLGTVVSADGTHTLVVTATKTLNGKTSSNTGTFSIDTVAPAVPTITGISNGTTYGTSVTPNVTNVSGVTYSSTLDGNPFNLGTSVSTDGTHTLVVNATKTLNGKTSSNTATFTIDTAAPSVPAFIGFSNGTTYGTSVTPNITQVAGNTYSATLDGSAYTLGTPVSTDGTHTLVVTATKTLNGKTSSNTGTFSIDTVAPAAPAFTGFSNGTTYGTSVTPNISTVAGNTYSATLDGNPFTLGTPVSTDGTHTLVVTATKTLNGKTSSNTGTFSIDTVAPAAPAFTGFSNGTTYGTSVTPDVTPVAGLTYAATLDGSAYTLGTPVATDGTHTLVITATKTLNGKTSSNTGTFSIDTVAPSVPTLTGVNNGTAYGTSVTPNVSAVAGVTYTATLDGSPFTLGSTISSDGAHTLVVTATKTINNKTSQTTVNFSIDTTAPDVNTIIITGAPGSEIGYTNSQTVNLTVAGTDASGITGWLVTESSSVPAASSVTNSQPTSFTFSSGDGLKTLYVWARDAAGNVSQSRSASITLDTVAPTSLAWSGSIPANQGTTYNFLTLTVSESIQDNIVGQSGTTTKGGSYIVTGVSGNEITINYSSPSGLVGLPTQKKDTITINNIKDSAGNSSNLSVQTNSLI